MDNNIAGRQIVTVTPAVNYELNAVITNSGLTSGLHTFNIRFFDDSNLCSAISTQLIDAFSANPQIVKYEYWFDSSYGSKTIVTLTPSANAVLNAVVINASAIQDGVHFFNIRFMDSGSKWSSVQSNLIVKSGTSASMVYAVCGYRYWIDNNFGNATYKAINVPVANVDVNANLDLKSFPKGNHLFSIQFKDTSGLWSSVMSQNIDIKTDGVSLLNVISGYRYWIDFDFTNNIAKGISAPAANFNFNANMDLKSFPKGNHLLNIQFKDTSGLWSAVSSQHVDIRSDGGTANQNVMSKYRYWLGSDFSNVIEKPVIPQVAYANINTNLDFSTTLSGTKILHIQFKDTSGLWSSVATDTMKVIHAIAANFSADPWGVCDSGNVAFTNISTSFANSFKWDFGDSSTSKLVNPSHFFKKLGTYSVKLLAIDTLSGIKDSLVKNVFVSTKPIVNLGKDTTIKSGQTLVLDAGNPGCTYHWSTGDTSKTISVSLTGTYYVEVSNKGCISTDTIKVAVSVGTNEAINKLESVHIYPNPGNRIVNISISLSSPETVWLTLYNPLGQMIGQKELKNANPNFIAEMDLSQLPAGFYFLSIKGQGWIKEEKIVKSEF